MAKINFDNLGVANGKLLKVKDLCIGAGYALLGVGLLADIFGTRWAPMDKIEEELKKMTTEDK